MVVVRCCVLIACCWFCVLSSVGIAACSLYLFVLLLLLSVGLACRALCAACCSLSLCVG